MPSLRIATCVFVKTPGFSKPKSRLGQIIGQQKAEEFYIESLKTIRELLKSFQSQSKNEIEIIWSVAEQECLNHKLWKPNRTLWQGSGGLGQRLHKTYSELILEKDAVFFLGADCPHLSLESLFGAEKSIVSHQFALGPADDGGYYLFAGHKPVPESIWLEVPYSQKVTFKEFKTRLEENDPVTVLENNFDIDYEEDLLRLKTQLSSSDVSSSHLHALVNWLTSNI